MRRSRGAHPCLGRASPTLANTGQTPYHRLVKVTKVVPYDDVGNELTEDKMQIPTLARLSSFHRYIYKPDKQEIMWPDSTVEKRAPPRGRRPRGAAPAGPSAASKPRRAPVPSSKALGPRVADLEAQNKQLAEENVRLWEAVDELRSSLRSV